MNYKEAKTEYEQQTGRKIRQAKPHDRAFNSKIEYVSPPSPSGGAWRYFEDVPEIVEFLRVQKVIVGLSM